MPKKQNPYIVLKCDIRSAHGPTVTFAAPAVELLDAFEARGVVFDESHASNAEVYAQKAIIRHCIEHNVSLDLKMDHWRQTLWVYLDVVVGRCGYIKTEDGNKFPGELLTKSDWADPPSGGGYLIANADNETIFKTNHIWY